jgi:16S rRNA C967 or C1407 C5-methylase (RsmB/RsmF family)/NOL1/NOP2/fmu family ribosome biogenesis protein
VKFPAGFINSLQGLPGFDQEAFEQVHEKATSLTSIRFNPAKSTRSDDQWDLDGATTFTSQVQFEKVPWSSSGFYLSSRPSFTFDPLFHAGSYYVQEASSMFLEQALVQLADLSVPLRVLDLSAAPGGKSTHIQSLLPQGSLLVSNEVIRSRCNILTDNIIKWGCSNVVVTNNDPSAFKKLEGFFDVIVVDAPCSGSGLFRKDPSAMDEWSLSNVALCSQRQQRILADVLPALKHDGLLIYSTCSYSREEDEAIGDWLTGSMLMKNKRLHTRTEWGVVESVSDKGNKGYRFYPDKAKGEGFFLACFTKQERTTEVTIRARKVEPATNQETLIAQDWIRDDKLGICKENDQLYAVPLASTGDIAALMSVLNVVYKGVSLGQVMKGKLVPHHALALSTSLHPQHPFIDLDYAQAILFLQRNELKIEVPRPGWRTVRFKGQDLGWINALPNRINNYYPKELRILKQQNDSGIDNL